MVPEKSNQYSFVLENVSDPHFLVDKIYDYAKNARDRWGSRISRPTSCLYMPSLSPLFVGGVHAAGYLSLSKTIQRIVLLYRADVAVPTVLHPRACGLVLGKRIQVDEVLTRSVMDAVPDCAQASFDDAHNHIRVALQQHMSRWRILTHIQSFSSIALPENLDALSTVQKESIEKIIYDIVYSQNDVALCVLGELHRYHNNEQTHTADHMAMTAASMGEFVQGFPDAYIYNIFVRLAHAQANNITRLGYSDSVTRHLSSQESVGYALGLAGSV